VIKLITAIEKREIAVALGLIKSNPMVVTGKDDSLRTPLHAACVLGDIRIAAELVAKGAPLNCTDVRGVSPLLLAVIGNHLELAELLIKRGADVNGRDGQGTGPLLAAVRAGSPGLAELLVKKKADVNAQDKGGTTPLMEATKAGLPLIARLLIMNGAKLDLADLHGNTAIALADTAGNEEILQLLIANGAEVVPRDGKWEGTSGGVDIGFTVANHGRTLRDLVVTIRYTEYAGGYVESGSVNSKISGEVPITDGAFNASGVSGKFSTPTMASGSASVTSYSTSYEPISPWGRGPSIPSFPSTRSKTLRGTWAAQMPTNAAAYNKRGCAYADKGDYDRAISDFDKALELDPNYAFAYSNRGYAYADKGDYDRAISDLDKALELDPRYAEAYLNRGLACYRKGSYDRAISDFDKALELNPKLALAYLNRGNAYRHKSDYDRAISDYKKFIELAPPEDAQKVKDVNQVIEELEKR
jgi:ankyrin repeat protein/cytochrome c-type biogenesis protein CcmH/NrfG